ncbi:MAG: hypothetical protein IKR43_03415 [Lachnospiraceae bacterium]|nr:hypothetical protein [Lachnospiraceae bacterium]
MDGKVLCGASAEQLKYYFNPEFARLPEAVRQELHDITVVMADRIGATFLMVFAGDGSLRLEIVPDEADFGYDEIEAELQIRALQREKEELFTQLEAFYQAFFTEDGE